MSKVRILSADLSLNCPGFCVATVENNVFTIDHVTHVNNKSSKLSHAEKLKRTKAILIYLCGKYHIDYVVRERGFSRFSATTQALFKVVGVSDVTIYEELGVSKIEEITPTEVKSLIGGHGKATKDEVEDGLRDLLSDSQKDFHFATDDESDAVAVALSFCIKNGLIV